MSQNLSKSLKISQLMSFEVKFTNSQNTKHSTTRVLSSTSAKRMRGPPLSLHVRSSSRLNICTDNPVPPGMMMMRGPPPPQYMRTTSSYDDDATAASTAATTTSTTTTTTTTTTSDEHNRIIINESESSSVQIHHTTNTIWREIDTTTVTTQEIPTPQVKVVTLPSFENFTADPLAVYIGNIPAEIEPRVDTIVSRCGGVAKWNQALDCTPGKVTRIRICVLYTSRKCVESATCIQQHEVKG